MHASIDATRRTVAQHSVTTSVTVDGSAESIMIRAMVDEITDDFESTVESLPCSIRDITQTPFGLEVTLA